MISWRENSFSHKIMRIEWAVHVAVRIEIFHPKRAKSEVWHCVSYGKFFWSRPWEGPAREGVGVSAGWGVWSWLPAWCHWWEPCRRQLLQKWGLLHKLAFRLFPVEMTLDPWWNHSGGFGLCTLKTKALSLLGVSDKLVLRQSLQKPVLLISCQNAWGFFS